MTDRKDLDDLSESERKWLAAMPVWTNASGSEIALKYDRLFSYEGDGGLDIVEGDPRDWDDPTPA